MCIRDRFHHHPKRVVDGGGQPKRRCPAHDRAVQRIDLGWFAPPQVLRGRGVLRGHLRGHIQNLLPQLFGKGHARSPGHRDAFLHHRAHQVAGAGLGVDHAIGLPGQRRERVVAAVDLSLIHI